MYTAEAGGIKRRFDEVEGASVEQVRMKRVKRKTGRKSGRPPGENPRAPRRQGPILSSALISSSQDADDRADEGGKSKGMEMDAVRNDGEGSEG